LADDITIKGAWSLAVGEGQRQPAQQLTLLGRAERALAEARSIEQVKEIRDQAEAVRTYARSASLGLEIQNYAAEVKLRAERKAGKVLGECKLRGGDRRSKSHDPTLKLSDLGITRDQSYRWQLEASVPDSEFERFVRECQHSCRELTSAALVRLARNGSSSERRDSRDAVDSDLEDMQKGLGHLIEQGQRFSCIWANPAWCEIGPHRSGSLKRLGPSCSARLVKLRIRDIAAEQAHLHVAVSADFLYDAMRVIDAWGFVYRSVLVLKGPPRAYGEFWRPACDFLLLGVRGRLPFRDNSLSGGPEVEDLSAAESPDMIRQRIERVSPGPYLEVQGREPKPGWTVLMCASSTVAEVG
jgi:hypothetical protein